VSFCWTHSGTLTDLDLTAVDRGPQRGVVAVVLVGVDGGEIGDRLQRDVGVHGQPRSSPCHTRATFTGLLPRARRTGRNKVRVDRRVYQAFTAADENEIARSVPLQT